MSDRETEEALESYGAEISPETSALTKAREWLLVDGDRLVISIGISFGVFVLFLVFNAVGVISVVNDDSVTRLAGGMIAGTFSLVTLVVSINQLILSREFTSADDASEQLEGVMDFRGSIAETAAVPAAPASPSRLLGLVVETLNERADDLAVAVEPMGDRETVTLIHRYTNRVEASTERIDETLAGTAFGTFNAVSAAVAFDAAWQLYVARHLKGRCDEQLPGDAQDALEDIIELLEQFMTAREHFKTTYLQRELTRFSQLTIYTGVPAILAAMALGFIYADFGGPTVSAAVLPVAVGGLVAVVVSPLALLVTYILRTATVTRRTASVGPMVPQKDPEAGPFAVSYGEEIDRSAADR